MDTMGWIWLFGGAMWGCNLICLLFGAKPDKWGAGIAYLYITIDMLYEVLKYWR